MVNKRKVRKAQYDVIGTSVVDTYDIYNVVANCHDLKMTRRIKRLLNKDSLMKYAVRRSQADKPCMRGDR